MSKLHSGLKQPFLINALILGALTIGNTAAIADDTLPATVSEWYDAVRQKNTDKINLLISRNFSAQSDYATFEKSGSYFINDFGKWFQRNNFQIVSTKTELSNGNNVIVSVCYSSSYGEIQTREIFNVSDQFITNFSQKRVADKCQKA